MAVLGWWEGSHAWSFVTEHAQKIRKKLRATPPADRVDLATELKWGLLLAQSPENKVSYEKYGSGVGRSPDYTVEQPEVAFNLEVKNLRSTDLETRLEEWEQRMRAAVSRAQPPHYVLAGFQAWDREDRNPQDWLQAVEASEERLAELAIASIQESELAVGERAVIPLGHGVSLLLSAVGEEPRRVGNAGSTIPVMYSQREHRKFGTLIVESLSQLRPGEINVLAIDTVNATHERCDLDDAIYELRGCEDSFFRRYSFEGRRDFWERARVLSGVVFRSVWVSPAFDRPRNHVWSNPDAVAPLPGALHGDLAFLDAPIRPRTHAGVRGH